MTKKIFQYTAFDIVMNFKRNELKLYEIDNNQKDDFDESDLFHVYSTSEANVESIVDKLNELIDDKEQLKQLLEVIRHELVALSGLKAFDICADKTENLTCVWNKDLIELNYNQLIKMIDNELEE